ncbi:hypothetical protein PV762_16750 [Mitsuaria sp. CC2]|uniref:hypothetical protein n=1 Tax=Mitsuaria sp. CC2 TaxID=3029186 RepID=UPI003B8B39C3
MKGLVISPGKGTTVSLKLQKYFSRAEATAAGLRERGTQAKYVGSFNSSLDPRRLAGVERIGPADDGRHGVTLTGVGFDGNPVELDADDIRDIRDWLLAHGSWARMHKSREEFRTEQERLKAVERAQLEAQLRAELTAQLRPQLQAELLEDMEARREHPLVEAVRAVEAAGAAVREEARRLVSDGHRLTTRRGRAAGGRDAPANRLLEMTLALRTQAFADFEATCKAAGLMAGRKTGRKGPKAR